MVVVGHGGQWQVWEKRETQCREVNGVAYVMDIEDGEGKLVVVGVNATLREGNICWVSRGI